MNHLTPPAVHCPSPCGRYMGAYYGKAQCKSCGRWNIAPWPEGALWVDTPMAAAAH